MKNHYHHKLAHLFIKACILTLFALFASCQDSGEARFELNSGEIIKLELAVSQEDQVTGLSGRADADFSKDQGMIFFNTDDRVRNFWMPDTYFDQDVFYLDKDFKVINIQRNVPHHPGWETPEDIHRMKPVFCRHVFEMRADSEIAKKIQLGDILKWKGSPSPEEILQEIRREQ